MGRDGWGTAFWKLLFPEKDVCSLCLQIDESVEKKGVCRSCVQKVLQVSEAQTTCPQCGFFTAGLACPICRSWREKTLHVGAVVPYEGMFRELIHDLKFNGKKKMAQPLGYLMACRLKRLGYAEKISAVIPIPLYSSRQKERGYNQSALLAKVIADELEKPLWSEILVREHFRHPQMVLSRQERMKNIAGAFKYTRTREMSQGTILLVDDIITTGATLLGCAEILYQAGARNVYAITWAAGYNLKLMGKIASSWFFHDQRNSRE